MGTFGCDDKRTHDLWLDAANNLHVIGHIDGIQLIGQEAVA